MKHHSLPLGLTAALCIAPATQASPILLAVGTLNGSSAGVNADLSGLTGTLENAVPANMLGGVGSGLAYAGGMRFIATPDRGPNAKTYDPLVDNTVYYISRFHAITMDLTPTPGTTLPYALTPNLTATTLMWSATALNYGDGSLGTGNGYTLGSGVPTENTAGRYYFTGRSDNFSGSGSTNPANARLDLESVRVSNDGNSIFVSDEYGPYVYQFARSTGERLRTFAIPANLAVATLGTTTAAEGNPPNTTGRVANKGMEGLAITPDGKTLVGIVQAPALQDTDGWVRIVTFDIATGNPTHQYAYQLTTGSGVSDIVAINDHEFLVDERDGKGLGDGSKAKIKQLFHIDLAGATDVGELAALSNSVMDGVVNKGVAKGAAPAIDLVTLLLHAGIGLTAADIPAKIEGIAFGPDLVLDTIDYHTLFVANDNDFVPSTAFADPGAPLAGPNQVYVIGIPFADLPGFEQQQIPTPGALWLIGAGLLGLRRHPREAIRTRRR
jgi:hypothetical protein